MAKKKKKRSFPGEEPRPTKTRARRRPEPHYNHEDVINADDHSPGAFGWFRAPGSRETIESLIIAVLLAFMFKTFEAEAFIIPTGSMAPSLQGQHYDLACEQCDYQYLVGSSGESSSNRTTHTHCPICHHRMRILTKSAPADHVSNSGDRILVNKFVYDFSEPERFDVIVFKNPQNGKQNFIKRLIGLPGENILIENGDIYVMTPDEQSGTWTREICRKPAKKLRQVLIDVDDTDFVGRELESVGWPSRWQQWTESPAWDVGSVDGKTTWDILAEPETQWLRYRHLAPNLKPAANETLFAHTSGDWSAIARVQQKRSDSKSETINIQSELELPPGRLISDAMSYNDGWLNVRPPQVSDPTTGSRLNPQLLPGLTVPGEGYHWVGDLGLEITCDIESDSGTLALDLVEGGAHFTCLIDVSTGQATLSCSDPTVQFNDKSGNEVATPTASTSVLGNAATQIMFLNADDQLFLWVNDKRVRFNASTYTRPDQPVPKYSPEDPGDAEPAGIGAKGLDMSISRLKIVRDIYYSSVNGDLKKSNPEIETGFAPRDIRGIFDDPESWGGARAKRLFETKRDQKTPTFSLEKGATRDKDQFLPMGDNSTKSLDGRMWPKNHYVERDMLIGRAILIYWPHTLNSPPYFPNFKKMKFIR